MKYHTQEGATSYGRSQILKLAYVSALTSLAVVLKLRFFEIPYPPLPFLRYDLSGVPISVIAFISLRYIPVVLPIYYVMNIILGSDPIGMAMKCVAEISTAIPLVITYKKNPLKIRNSATLLIATIVLSTLARVGSMCVANYMVTPYWLLWSRLVNTLEDAITITLAYMPHIIAFNSTSALIISTLSVKLYDILKRAGFMY